MNEVATIRPASNVEAYRASTDAAELCKSIVVATSSTIQKRRYVSVEGWQAVARAHGCAAGARDVERVEGGVRAIGEVRDILTGQLIATAEGFVGEDEPVWYGGGKDKWGKPYVKRPDYAIRAMAQTRAMSRACRSAFAHVVVMMNAGLQTTPAEEVPFEGFGNDPPHNPQTGEIIEGEVVDDARREPAAREKLDGPHTSKTALREAVHAIVAKVRAVETLEALDALKSESKRTINQALRDWPLLINGDPEIEEDLGLKGEIEKRRGELTRSTEFQFLMSLVSESRTAAELQTVLNVHGDAIGELDGEEAREFERAYDAKAEALKNPTPLEAGAFGG